MARTPKEDYRPLMVAAAVKHLQAGEEVKIQDIAAELKVSTALVHFYFKEKQDLVAAAWREIFLSFVAEDQQKINDFTPEKNWPGLAELAKDIFSKERDEIHLAHFRGLYEAQRNPKFAMVADEVHQETINSWEQIMRRAEEMGIVKLRIDPQALALLFVAIPPGIAGIKPHLTDHERNELALLWVNMLRSVLDIEEGTWIEYQ